MIIGLGYVNVPTCILPDPPQGSPNPNCGDLAQPGWTMGHYHTAHDLVADLPENTDETYFTVYDRRDDNYTGGYRVIGVSHHVHSRDPFEHEVTLVLEDTDGCHESTRALTNVELAEALWGILGTLNIDPRLNAYLLPWRVSGRLGDLSFCPSCPTGCVSLCFENIEGN